MEAKNKPLIVFFGLDAYGHINPVLSIVAELRRRGYRVIILTMRQLSMASKLEDKGFELDYCITEQSKGVQKEEDSEANMLAVMKPMCENFRKSPLESIRATYSEGGVVEKFLMDVIENHHLIKAKLEALKPDLIVLEHVIPVPCAITIPKLWVRFYASYTATIYGSMNENFVGSLGLKLDEMTPELKQLEREIKQSIITRARNFCLDNGVSLWANQLDLCPTSPYLNLCLGPNELSLDLVPELKPLPEKWFRLEHTLDESSADNREFQIPDSLKDCPGKLIYFSLGTLVSCDIEMINRLLEILSKSPNKFIISMGQFAKYIHLYPNMWGERHVNQKSILSKIDLFITHAGHNSVIEAFYYGVPGIIALPVFADQFDSAQRIQDCGFGIRLSPNHCTQQELLSSIESLLANEELKKRMQAISSRLKSIKYHELAADRIEQLLTVHVKKGE